MNLLTNKILFGCHFFVILMSFALSANAGKIKELLILAEESVHEELSYLGDIELELTETQMVEIDNGIKIKTIVYAIATEKGFIHNFYCEVDFHQQNEKWTPSRSHCE